MNTLVNDSALADATIVAVSMTPCPVRSGADLELAAHVCRIEAGRVEEVGGSAYVRIPAAQPSQGEIVRRSGLDAEQVDGLPGAGIALAYLDMHLTNPPYVLAVHQAQPFLDVLAQHRDRCPALAASDVVDTALWARRQHAIPPGVPLAVCARRLRIHDIPETAGAGALARLTAAVFARLAAEESPGAANLTELVREVGHPSSLPTVAV
jgi:hypothetical protein